jgi:hypothetical protein
MAANGNIIIMVRNLAHGDAQPVSISPNATIMDLQRAITNQHIVDTYPENLKLFKNSTRNNMSVDIFDPNMTIADCNINDGEEIYALMHDVNYLPPLPPALPLRRQNAYNPAFNGPINEYLRRGRNGGKRSRRNRKTRNRKNRKTRNRKH